MIIGPVFWREVAITPRRPRFFIYRALYPAALLLLMCTAWSILAGAQIVRGVGDMARFGSALFQVLATLQLAVIIFFSALASASSVAQEKDRRTLILLLMSRLRNDEIVLGKLMASLLNVMVMLAAGLPLFALVVLLGGVSFGQVGRALAVTVATALAAGSLGTTVAFWREKTFQTLAITALVLVFWLGAWEAVAAGVLGSQLAEISSESWATGFSPLRAILAATRWRVEADQTLGALGNPINVFLVTTITLAAGLNLLAILRVRTWNPSREVRRRGSVSARATAQLQGIQSVRHDQVSEPTQSLATDAAKATQTRPEPPGEATRARHVKASPRASTAIGASREVWDNPILWRELRTRAYGHKVIMIRIAYLLLSGFVVIALYQSIAGKGVFVEGDNMGTAVPAAAKSLVPLFLVSLVIINALAVTSITTERDGRCLDLLLVTDISPREFIFGKLGGVFWVTKEMVLLPILLCVGLWAIGGLSLENLLYLLGGLLVMDAFVAALGLHCAMAYANSRNAISISLGIVFFLFLGVATCILMMISFSGSFQAQLAPFFAFILGGGVGLYVALGVRNPSAAIGFASLLVPFFTFYAVVSFLLYKPGFSFLAVVSAYGFSTAAILIPALHEFDFAMGRTTAGED